MADPGRRARRRRAARRRPVLLLALVLAAVRWRRASSVAVVLAAAAAFAAACLGPLWAAASQDALGTERVRTAPVEEREVVVLAEANTRRVGTVRIPVLALRDVEQASALPEPAGSALGPSRLLLATERALAVRGAEDSRGLAPLAWMDGSCERLPVVAGRCGSDVTDVVLSTRTAALLRLGVGDVLEVPDLAAEPERPGSGAPFPRELRVTGLYRTGGPEQEHWRSTSLFAFGPAREVDGELVPARLDAVLTSRTLLEDTAVTVLQASARRSLLADPRTGPEQAAVEDGMRAWSEGLAAGSGQLRVTTPALELLGSLRPEGDAARRAALVLGAQLLALSCCVLALVVAGSADARAPDVGLGRLRGLRRIPLGAFCVAEPLLLLAVAAPLGCLAGAAGTAALAEQVLPGRVVLRPDGALAAALVVAALGAVLAVAVGARRVLARGSVLPLPAVAGAGAGRLLLDGVVVTLAVVALWRVVGEDSPAGSGFAAPVLAAVAAGLLLARGGQLLARLWVAWSSSRPGVAGFLAARRTARLDGGVRTVVLTAAALACASYAALVLVLTDEQRTSQAAMEVGAATSYQVEPVDVDDLLGAVERADPTGSELAAVMTARRRSSTGQPTLLGVDAQRLAAVAAWDAQWARPALADLAAALRPPTAPTVVLTGTQVTVDVSTRLEPTSRGAALQLRLVDARGEAFPVGLGQLVPGDARLSARIPTCDKGCRLAGLTVVKGRALTLIGSVDVRGLQVDGRAVSGLSDPAGWRPSRVETDDPLSPLSTRVEAAGDALSVVFATPVADQVGVLRADVPDGVPVLLAGGAPPDPVGRDDLVSVPTADGEVLLASVAGRADVLPRLADTGYLVDLALVQRAAPLAVRGTVQEVWSARPPDEATRAALTAAGLQVVQVTGAPERAAALAERGPARVLALLPVVTVVALALAVLGQVAHVLSTARPRAVEAAALQAVGATRRSLRRAVVQESAVLLGLGTVAGVVAGTATALLTAADVGALGLTGPVAPFPDELPWQALGGATGLAVVLLGIVALLCARVGLRRPDPQLLRQAVT